MPQFENPWYDRGREAAGAMRQITRSTEMARFLLSILVRRVYRLV